jgi:hypothetical protein
MVGVDSSFEVDLVEEKGVLLVLGSHHGRELLLVRGSGATITYSNVSYN